MKTADTTSVGKSTKQHSIKSLKTVLLLKVNDSPALKCFHCVEVGCIAYISEEYTDSRFTVSECSCPVNWIYPVLASTDGEHWNCDQK
jgi:hypothetical protein